MRFDIDTKSIWILILCLVTNELEIYIITMISMILHELGHIVVGLLLGIKLKKIKVLMIGFSIDLLETQNNEVKKILICLAGPITNLIVALGGSIVGDGIYTQIVIYTNILLAGFNMLPIYPLDGGRVLKSLIHMKYGRKNAIVAIRNISCIAVITLTLCGVFLIILLENIGVIFTMVMLWVITINEEKRYRQRRKIYEIIEKI